VRSGQWVAAPVHARLECQHPWDHISNVSTAQQAHSLRCAKTSAPLRYTGMLCPSTHGSNASIPGFTCQHCSAGSIFAQCKM
jgi:hypothetical protein